MGLCQQEAYAQASLADDVIAAQQGEADSYDRGAPSLRGHELRGSPGESGVIFSGAEANVPLLVPGPRGEPGRPGAGLRVPERETPRFRERLKGSPPPIFLTAGRLAFQELEGPVGMETGPPGGLTLDAAIDRLLTASTNLRTAAHALPDAEADILTAGLRTNPLLFYGVADVPYGSYSEQRPGETEHAISVVHPIDFSGKRRARVASARAAKVVLEAQYQDLVRNEIDTLYGAFVEVLIEREVVAMNRRRASVLVKYIQEARGQVQRGIVSEVDYQGLLLEYEVATYLQDEAEDRLWEAKLGLATLLGYPPGTVDHLELSGALRMPETVSPPPTPDLVRLAMTHRPDLVARRLAIHRATADVDRERAERFADAFALYQPFTYHDNAPTGGRSATSWGAGAFVSIPLYDRNQGNLRRAELDTSRVRVELEALERRIEAQVERAARRYRGTLQDIERLERQILPIAEGRRDALIDMLLKGEPDTDIDDYLAAQRDYGSILRQLLDVLAEHRRSMLDLNTVVGQRIMP